MRSHADFLKGLVTGTAAGVGMAILLRTDVVKNLLGGLSKSSSQRPYPWDAQYPQRFRSPILRREIPERGGNPASLSPEKSSYSATPFERLSGAPHSPTGAEQISVPGRPGETADLSDPSQGVRPAGRAIHVPDAESGN